MSETGLGAVRDVADDIEPGPLAEGVHREDGLRAGSDGVLDEVRVDVCGITLGGLPASEFSEQSVAGS